MTVFRLFLVLLWLVLVGYTAVVIAHHGLGLLSIYFGDMGLLGWPGQFNLDFLFMLLFSALWVAWRHHFSAAGLALSLLALLGGALFLSTYLFVLSWRTNGNPKAILIGPDRA